MIMQWTQDNDDRLRAYFNAGLNDKRIGLKFGCSQIVIKRRRHQLRLLRQAPMGHHTGVVVSVSSRDAQLDALFRAAERPAKREAIFNRQAPPTLVSNGSAMS